MSKEIITELTATMAKLGIERLKQIERYHSALDRLVTYVEIEMEGRDMTHGLDMACENAKTVLEEE